jgi:hypothetical protein
MSSASVSFDFVASTLIQSSQVDQNFADLVSFLNTHVVHNHPDQWPASMARGLQGTVKSRTTDFPATSGTTPLTLFTLDAFTPVSANRRIVLSFQARLLTQSVQSDNFAIWWKRDGTQFADQYIDPRIAGGDPHGMTFVQLDDSPSAASHTYTVGVVRSTGSGTLIVECTSTGPSRAWATDIGGT